MDLLKGRAHWSAGAWSSRWAVLAAVCGVLATQACVYDYQALKGIPETGSGGQTPGTGGRASDTGGSMSASGGAASGGLSGQTGGTSGTGGNGSNGSGGSLAGSGGTRVGSGGTASGGADAGGNHAGEGGHAAGAGGAAGLDFSPRGGQGGTVTGAGGSGAGGGVTGSGGTASGGQGAAGGGRAVGGAAGLDPDLVLLYGFDDGTGTTAADTSGFAGGPRAAQLVTAGTGGAIAFSTTHQVGAYSVSLSSNQASGGGYLVVPTLFDLAPTAVTISVWANLTATSNWQRIFDYGTGATQYMMLTPANTSGSVRFAITKGGSGAEERIDSTKTIPIGGWHHFAVVLSSGSKYTGTLYVDGVAVGTNTAMTLHPVDLGATTNNYLGRSQYTADSYFSALIDDYRVYRRGLTSSEVTALFALR